ncbi:MAG: DUF302 domain-containing protein [Hydrogenophilaceae bacterium]
MKRAIPLLAAFIATAALADPDPMQLQAAPPMMVPGSYNPFMMPGGMPMQQMQAVPYGMPMQQAMPYGGNPYQMMQMPQQAMPYGGNPYQMMQMPQQAMPQAMPYGNPYPVMQMPQQPMPAAAAPAMDPLTALTSSLAQTAGPAIASFLTPQNTAAGTPAGAPAGNPFLPNLTYNPLNMIIGMAQPSAPKRPYEMRRVIDQGEKTQMMQMALPMMTTFMRMGMPDMMNYMARKYKAKPGLSFDDVRDSLFLRANQLNMKKVGENLMWKDFQAVLNDKDAPRIEVYSFCDIEVGRDLLKLSPEFIIFLPCRIAVMEDANKDVWVLMVDWNMDWVAGYEKQLGITDGLSKGAKSINDRMVEMMQAGANGDL